MTETNTERSDALAILQANIGGCREWLPENADKCWAPAEYVLWGKLIPPEGLGPRCYHHAAKWIDHHGLRPQSNYALINLNDLAQELAEDRCK